MLVAYSGVRERDDVPETNLVRVNGEWTTALRRAPSHLTAWFHKESIKL